MMENKTIFLPSMIKKQEVNTMEVDPQIALGILEAACSQEPVEGLTHTFYKYPARFSPQFARQVIESFTDIGDVVFDPFMGGGTTLVEASALGRIAIGSDINSLAVYISKVKTYLLSQVDMEIIQDWLLNISYGLSLRNRIEYDQEWEQLGYYRNIE